MHQNNSLILSTVALWEVHHADTLEIVNRLNNDNHQVFMLSCDGELNSCPANPLRKDSLCRKCRKYTEYTEQQIISPSVTTLRLRMGIFHGGDFKLKTDEDLLLLYYEEMPIGRLVASQLADQMKGVYGFINTFGESNIRKLIENGINLYESIKNLIYEYKIDNVYVWNGRRPSDGPALYAAKRLNKKAFAFISGGRIGKIQIVEDLSVQSIPATREQLVILRNNLLNNSLIYKEGIEFYQKYRTGAIKQVGYVRFNENSTPFKRQNFDKPVLLVVSSSPSESIHTPEHFKFYGCDPFDVMYKIAAHKNIVEKYQVIFRWHPGKSVGSKIDLEKIQKISDRKDGVLHIGPDSNIDTYDLLEQSSVVLSFGSTVGYVAALQGKPVVIAGPAAFLFDSGVYTAKSAEQAIEMLQSDLISLPKDEVILLGYWFNSFGTNMQYIKQVFDENGYVSSSLIRGKDLILIHPRPSLVKKYSSEALKRLKNVFGFLYKKIRI